MLRGRREEKRRRMGAGEARRKKEGGKEGPRQSSAAAPRALGRELKVWICFLASFLMRSNDWVGTGKRGSSRGKKWGSGIRWVSPRRVAKQRSRGSRKGKGKCAPNPAHLVHVSLGVLEEPRGLGVDLRRRQNRGRVAASQEAGPPQGKDEGPARSAFRAERPLLR